MPTVIGSGVSKTHFCAEFARNDSGLFSAWRAFIPRAASKFVTDNRQTKQIKTVTIRSLPSAYSIGSTIATSSRAPRSGI
jgi:hypothetical protein